MFLKFLKAIYIFLFLGYNNKGDLYETNYWNYR